MISVLAGAGASSAVNKDNYPTTADFFSGLGSDITGMPLYKLLLRYLPEQKQQDVVDIEQVLWLIADLKSVVDATGTTKVFPGWLLGTRQLSTLQVNQNHAGFIVQAFRKLGDHANTLEITIQRRVYDLYHRPPTPDELEFTWTPLLKGLLNRDSPVELFTTNYDIVLETAIRQSDLPVNVGRDPTLEYPRLDDRLWDTEPTPDNARQGLLTKLHGSVHWKRGSDGSVYVGDPTDRSKDSGNVIIYPGFKGSELGQPFDMFHSYLQKCIRNSEIVVVIGYAFRDIQINAALRTHLNSNAILIVVDPTPQPARMPPLDDRLKVIDRGFDREAVTKIFEHVDAHSHP